MRAVCSCDEKAGILLFSRRPDEFLPGDVGFASCGQFEYNAGETPLKD
jgi:hypothetical protein